MYLWAPIHEGALTDTHGHVKSISCLGHLSWRLAISRNRPLDFYASLLSGTYRSKCKNNKKSITTDDWVLFFCVFGRFCCNFAFSLSFLRTKLQKAAVPCKALVSNVAN